MNILVDVCIVGWSDALDCDKLRIHQINNTKLMKDIMNTVNQVTDGLKESTGVDLSAVLSGFLAGKVGSEK